MLGTNSYRDPALKSVIGANYMSSNSEHVVDIDAGELFYRLASIFTELARLGF